VEILGTVYSGRLAAPAVAIIAYDTEFYNKLDKLFPHTDARSWYEGKPEVLSASLFSIKISF
jgi:hypothetical protein